MAESPFQSALGAVLSPLEFAARDGFAHIDRVRSLEATVHGALERTCGLAIPRDVRDSLARVAKRFAEPIAPEKREREITRALERLRPLADPVFSETALARPPGELPGVGPKRAELLARRGVSTVADLLFRLPIDYDDRRELVDIGGLEIGRRATFVGRVLVSDFLGRRPRYGGGRGRGGRAFQAVVGDDTGTVELKWFHGGDAISKVARKDAVLLVTGDVKRYRFSKELLHPEIEVVESEAPSDADSGDGDPEAAESRLVVPVYSTPEGIHPRALRRWVESAVSGYADLLVPHLPDEMAAARGLPSPAAAVRQLHAPVSDSDLDALAEGVDPARTRLVLEELYLLELGLALRREHRTRQPGIPLIAGGDAAKRAESRLPFRLTSAQQRVWSEIRGDLSRPVPMNRLLEGDVGSGKTVIAFLAGVETAANGYQTALMAPTELLAEQHLRTLEGLARAEPGETPLRIELLTSSLGRARADEVRARLAGGEVDLVVGTHALIQDTVGFERLGLVVTDEQHRFGVKQRAGLTRKARDEALPHTLVMTATPIPRTLALTLYGDLDLSVIDELPPGRTPVRTELFRATDGRQVTELLRETTDRGEQVYVVYPLVEVSEKLDLRAASESAERIRAAFPGLAVDLVHGRLDADARRACMERFGRGETQVLVSTTVIEVGVDVPNATLMVVEHAERFGLAQLHQLRGRVGRGEAPGTCALVARGGTEDSEARLAALLETTDGFKIAEADLRIRGPGEFLGTRQHGHLPDLRIADLARDAGHVAAAREAALATVRVDRALSRRPDLLRAVTARWGERLALADVG